MMTRYRSFRSWIARGMQNIEILFPREIHTSNGQTIKLGRLVDCRYASLHAEGQNLIDDHTKISGEIHLGRATTIGSGSNLFGNISIGRYCQFGPNVAIYADNHPLSHLSIYTNYRLFQGRLKDEHKPGHVIIGHDVWLGHGAIILPNVTIGNGAIIGAGAVVTKDVDEFTIVVGNPAYPIRKRFSEEIISTIKRLQWWDYPPEQLNEIEDIFHLDLIQNPREFIERAEAYLTHA